MGNCAGGPKAMPQEPLQERIQVVVVLMMENRSFDHMLGLMKRDNPEIDGLTGEEFNLLKPDDPGSASIKISTPANFQDNLDPKNDYYKVKAQIYGSEKPAPDVLAGPGPMSGFAAVAEGQQKNASKAVMAAYSPEQLPVYRKLVSEFAVFDRWFSSVPTSTQPNRLFVHAASSNGLVSNKAPDLVAGLPQKTIFDALYDENYSFGIYFQSIAGQLVFQNLRSPKYYNNFKYYHQLKQDAEAGTLPNYVFIEPRYFGKTSTLPQNDDHPPADIREGQKLVKEIYEILRGSPQWPNTLLIITYDAHGGFYDHVPPPSSGVPNPDGQVAETADKFAFDRLGVRVPTIMVSPWIKKGTVVHGPKGSQAPQASSQFEHASIPATVKRIFRLPHFLSQRDAWAATFEDLVMQQDKPRTDCPMTISLGDILSQPATREPGTPSRAGAGVNTITQLQHLFVQLAAGLNQDMAAAKKPLNVWSVQSAEEFIDRNLKTFFQRLRVATRHQDVAPPPA